MSKEGTLMTVGVLVLISPFLGLPMTWLAFLLPVLGAVTITVAQFLRRERTAPPAPRAEAYAPTPEPSHYDAPSSIA